MTVLGGSVAMAPRQPALLGLFPLTSFLASFLPFCLPSFSWVQVCASRPVPSHPPLWFVRKRALGSTGDFHSSGLCLRECLVGA